MTFKKKKSKLEVEKVKEKVVKSCPGKVETILEEALCTIKV